MIESTNDLQLHRLSTGEVPYISFLKLKILNITVLLLNVIK